LNKPIISVSTLEAMTEAVRPFVSDNSLLCPMIDARRMEVYCRLTQHEQEIWATRPLVVTPDVFADFDEEFPIYLFGDGSAKTREVLNDPRCIWLPDVVPQAKYIGQLAWPKWKRGHFEDIAYFEPQYLKPFQAKPAKKLI